jgi:transcriptional regulator with PAS, ATPase and Fis domain
MKQFGKECEPLGSELVGYLQNLDWPGNVRELSNGIARYVLIGREAAIVSEHSQKTPPVSSSEPFTNAVVPLKRRAKEAVRAMERTVIVDALRANQWNRRKTAQALKISYRALIYKIRDAGLSPRNSQSPPKEGGSASRPVG